MTALLESRVLWGGLSWLCLLGFALWLIALLFPVPGPSDDATFDNGENGTEQVSVVPENLQDI